VSGIPLPIETERLIIRAFEPESDADAMVDVYCDPEVMRFIPGGALAGVAAVRAALNSHEEAQRIRGFSSWAVVERATERVIGDAGFEVFGPTGDVELGYTLARDSWGKGYAVEAASACLAAGAANLAVPRIVAVVDAENDASMRVAERIGMKRIDAIEAYGRPHILFGHSG
jgi:ribosomal-protein-alanine N-acetyltransferase